MILSTTILRLIRSVQVIHINLPFIFGGSGGGVGEGGGGEGSAG